MVGRHLHTLELLECLIRRHIPSKKQHYKCCGRPLSSLYSLLVKPIYAEFESASNLLINICNTWRTKKVSLPGSMQGADSDEGPHHGKHNDQHSSEC